MHRACLAWRSVSAAKPVSSVSTLSDLVSQMSLNPSPLGVLATRAPLVNHESRRFGRCYKKFYNWPNDFLPFHWERPKTDPPYMRTGDAVRDIGIWDPKSPIPGAENSKELKNAPEIVRRIFSLEFAARSDVVEFQRRKIIAHIQRHPFDQISPEVQIANLTVKIRNNLHYFTKIDKYDSPRKIRQNGWNLKRSSLLKKLFYQDRERYDYIIRVLGISHTIPKLGVMHEKTTRKGELRRLTREFCDNIKEERLADYHEELKGKRFTLQDEIDKIEQLIREEEKYLGTQNPAPPSQTH